MLWRFLRGIVEQRAGHDIRDVEACPRLMMICAILTYTRTPRKSSWLQGIFLPAINTQNDDSSSEFLLVPTPVLNPAEDSVNGNDTISLVIIIERAIPSVGLANIFVLWYIPFLHWEIPERNTHFS
jgi:hypothetical protein